MTGLANFEKVKGETNMKKKGFTLVELLVVIAIIALLMGILMPALARVRQIAYRMICGTHLKGIGSSMLLYANDNGESYPIAGLASSVWTTTGKIASFDEQDQAIAFTRGQATITSCLFMLIKNYDMTPSQFICKGDAGATLGDVASQDVVADPVCARGESDNGSGFEAEHEEPAPAEFERALSVPEGRVLGQSRQA